MAKENLRNLRAESAIRERAIRTFLTMGTPGVLAKWLFANGGIQTPDVPSMKAVSGR